MKRLIILILTVFTITGYAKEKTDWEINGLKGKVKKIKEYEAEDKYGKLIKTKLKSITLYNKSGYIIEENINKRFNGKILYNYDDKGLLIEMNFYDSEGLMDLEGNIKEKWDGRFSEYMDLGRINQKSIFKYDEKLNRIEVNRYESDGSIIKNTSFFYNEKNELIEIKIKHFGKLEYIEQFIYNKGQIIKYISYKSDGLTFHNEIYKYNDIGQHVETEYCGPINEISLTTNTKHLFKYNGKGYLTEENREEKGNLTPVRIYKYDALGNIEIKDYNPNGSLHHKEKIKYDKKGNIIEYIFLDDKNFLTNATIYELEYY